MDISKALRSTRNEAGKSQEFMALELEISRRTVQNWENGVSEPTISQATQWFNLVGKNPVPYLLEYAFPVAENLSAGDDDKKLRRVLLELIQSLPEEGIRQLMYLLCGRHGSSPRAIMQLVTAHLQTPLHDRVTQAGVIVRNYEIAKKKGTVTCPDNIQPDLDFLKSALASGENAVINDAREYTLKE